MVNGAASLYTLNCVYILETLLDERKNNVIEILSIRAYIFKTVRLTRLFEQKSHSALPHVS